jgi:arylsulfatase A-like enzyme
MATHAPLARNVDQPIAALLTDLERRGMLDETLVVWTTEFGRTPYHEKPDHAGREHHHQVFSSWLAGGGVKRGLAYGASDEFGIAPAENRVHVHDLHATILHQLGLDHERLTFRHAGRDYRLTDVHGHVVQDILA